MPAEPVILALDTASAQSVVAVVGAGFTIEQSHVDARGHAEVLIPLVRAVIAEAGITRPEVVACGVGPGPYTGLRVGIATARALALSWSVPVVGVCSLDAVAWAGQSWAIQSAIAAGPFGVAMDARRREIYWATYDEFGQRTGGPGVCSPGELPADAADLNWIGSAVAALPAQFRVLQPQPWGELGLRGIAGAIGRRMQHELLTGNLLTGNLLTENLPTDLAPTGPLADHGTDSGATAQGISGRVILAAEPLYLRRPDAVAMHS